VARQRRLTARVRANGVPCTPGVGAPVPCGASEGRRTAHGGCVYGRRIAGCLSRVSRLNCAHRYRARIASYPPARRRSLLPRPTLALAYRARTARHPPAASRLRPQPALRVSYGGRAPGASAYGETCCGPGRLDLLRSLSPSPHRAASRHPAHHQLTRYPVNKCTGECPSRDAKTTLVEDAVERLHGAIRFSQQFIE
jgi:hypothetical protein